MEISADDPRAHLVPEGDLLRDLGVLVDARLDLERPVDELVLGELVDDQLAVIGRVAARGQPGDHVLALARHHGQHAGRTRPAARRASRMIM